MNRGIFNNSDGSKNYSYIILMICVSIFILYNIFGFDLSLLALQRNYILSRPWTLISYQFLHISFNHLLFNMLFLYFFGPSFENIVGSNKFLLIYLTSGIIAGLGHILTSFHPVIGASGSLFGIFACLAIMAPFLKVYLFFFIPMKIAHVLILFILIDFIMIGANDHIARIAHLSGAFAGLAWGFQLKKTHNIIH